MRSQGGEIWLSTVAFHFPRVIDAINRRIAEKNSDPGIFLEYFWDMRWCDYCWETQRLFELESVKELGVFWYDQRVPNHPGVELYLTRLRITPNSTRLQQEMMLEVNERADYTWCVFTAEQIGLEMINARRLKHTSRSNQKEEQMKFVLCRNSRVGLLR
jgi:hypothetical protein